MKITDEEPAGSPQETPPPATEHTVDVTKPEPPLPVSKKTKKTKFGWQFVVPGLLKAYWSQEYFTELKAKKIKK